jgi:hydroxymethylpyrimidine pyrophosphatase-like HAD family hydrolase
VRYRVLATDYDSTLATEGRVGGRTIAALERLRASGRKLVLVTGRELEELLALFPEVVLFERVVAENGALLYRPQSKDEELLADRPPETFMRELQSRGVWPISVGRVIVATHEPYEVAVLGAIRDLGLELQVIFNKGAVMILPGGITKATGLRAALRELGLSRHNTVGIGDAENDHAMLGICECAAAVANALPALRASADLVTRGDHGDGVIELIERILTDDLAELAPRLTRHHLLIGWRANGEEFRVPPYGGHLLLVCPKESRVPAAAAAFMRNLAHAGYQYCLIQPEGLSDDAGHDVVLGTTTHVPSSDEVLQALSASKRNVAVVLAGLFPEAWPEFTRMLLRRLEQMRAETSRPHWIIINHAHELLPREAADGRGDASVPGRGMFLATCDPATLSPAPLAAVETAIVSDLKALAALNGHIAAKWDISGEVSQPDEMFVWQRAADEAPYPIRIVHEAHSPDQAGMRAP